MNRKLGQFDSTSSFDLMLDVLSNVFGGVILISCLLAILPRHSAPPPLWPAQRANSEMIERRIESAKSELAKLRSEIDRLSSSPNASMAGLYTERDELRKTLESLDRELGTLAEEEKEEAESSAAVALGNVEGLAIALKKLEGILSDAENTQTAMREKIKFLEKRMKTLGEKIREMGEGQFYAVRFPKERGRGDRPFPIMVHYGRVYPTLVGDPLEGNDAVRKLPVDEDAVMMSCIPGKGYLLPRDAASLLETLREAKKRGCYVSIYLYPDSHGMFQELKSQIFAAKIGYGLEFVEKDRRLIFSSEGSSPPEL